MYRNLRLFIIISFNVDLCVACMVRYGCEVYNNTDLFCNATLDIARDSSENITTIEICYLNKTDLILDDILGLFPNLKALRVKFGAFNHIVTDYGVEHNKLEVIVINNATISDIDETVFSNFKHLQVLDLRNNSLHRMHNDQVELLKRIPTIYLSGNKWNCSENLDWVYYFSNKSSIKDLNTLTCHEEPFQGKPIHFIAEVLHRVNEECPMACECTLINVFRNSDIEELQPVIEVDCSGGNYTALPESLPEHAKILKIQGNRINDLSPLIKNPIYREVTDLYIDDNSIESIGLLEGSYWLRNFRVLSLKGNKLSELPTYAMDNSLQQNPNMPNAIMLYLGSNPWRCDCVFTPSFQEDILVKYESQIQDMLDIKCSYVEGDENSMTSIVLLSRSSICQLPNEYSIQILDLVNGILASLIVLVLGKLAYDYYYFKKTGKLPWIVTKMP